MGFSKWNLGLRRSRTPDAPCWMQRHFQGHILEWRNLRNPLLLLLYWCHHCSRLEFLCCPFHSPIRENKQKVLDGLVIPFQSNLGFDLCLDGLQIIRLLRRPILMVQIKRKVRCWFAIPIRCARILHIVCFRVVLVHSPIYTRLSQSNWWKKEVASGPHRWLRISG